MKYRFRAIKPNGSKQNVYETDNEVKFKQLVLLHEYLGDTIEILGEE